MIVKRITLSVLYCIPLWLLSSCAYDGNQGTIAELDSVQLELKDTDVEDGLDKAMQGYQKFLEETPESQLTPEAIRRLADLKVEKEYGVVTEEGVLDSESDAAPVASAPEVSTKPVSTIDSSAAKPNRPAGAIGNPESVKDFEKRATETEEIKSAAGREQVQLPKGEAGADLQNTGAEEAITLYKKILEKYPM